MRKKRKGILGGGNKMKKRHKRPKFLNFLIYRLSTHAHPFPCSLLLPYSAPKPVATTNTEAITTYGTHLFTNASPSSRL